MKGLFSGINDAHLDEWVKGSAISEDIAKLNLKSVSSKREIATFLGWKDYKHSEGWIAGGQFKPDTPIQLPTAEKPAKYFTSKTGYDAILLKVSDPDYWAKVEADPSILIILTEGAKKAGSCLTQGDAAIGLCGVTMGFKKGGKELVPSLERFTVPGRTFVIAFDSDKATKDAVLRAEGYLAQHLTKQECHVKTTQWDPSLGKGIDDLIVNQGSETYRAVVDQAQLWDPRNLLYLKDPDMMDVDEGLQHLQQLSQIPKPNLLPPSLMDPLNNLAARLNLPVEGYVSTLLAVAASQLNSTTRLLVDPGTKFLIPPILWMGIVGESGSKKSPLLKAITEPLEQLQEDEEMAYQEKLDDYKRERKDWERQKDEDKGDEPQEPKPCDVYLYSYTLEALAQVLHNQPNDGQLVYLDELASFFSQMDAYRGGKGGDRQHWLSFYDGKPFKSNRKTSDRVYASKPAISMIGGIQPSIVQKLWAEDASSEDGLWSRFAWVGIPLTKSPGIQEGTTYDLTDRLAGLYRKLREVQPQQYRIDLEGIRVWNEWHHQIEDQIMAEGSNTLRAILPKARERAARIALVIHIIKAVMDGRVPSQIIPAETLRGAIQFADWLKGQTYLLYSDIGVTDNPHAAHIHKVIQRWGGQGLVTPRQLQANWPVKKGKPKTTEVRAFMADLVARGLAKSNDKDSTARGYAIEILTTVQQFNKQAESLAQSDDEWFNKRFNNGSTVQQTVPTASSPEQAPSPEANTQMLNLLNHVEPSAEPLKPSQGKGSSGFVEPLNHLEKIQPNTSGIQVGWYIQVHGDPTIGEVRKLGRDSIQVKWAGIEKPKWIPIRNVRIAEPGFNNQGA